MAELTERGLLEQPHTSAGRRPTEDGYRLYVQEFVGDGLSLGEELIRQMHEAAEELVREQEAAARNFARYMSDLTNETVFVSVGDSVFMTGISNLFNKPEFQTPDLLCEFSAMFDRIDELVHRVSAEVFEEDPYVGAEIELMSPEGDILPGRITVVEGGECVVDFNHPLAGQALTFEIELVEILPRSGA